MTENPWMTGIKERLVSWGIWRPELSDMPEEAISALLQIETQAYNDASMMPIEPVPESFGEVN